MFTSYFVITLTALGYGLEGAGAMYSLAMTVAVPRRIFWGWLGSGHVAPRLLMAWLAIGMAAGAAVLGMVGAATGGMLSFGQLDGLILPLVYALTLWLTGNHGIGFLLCGLPGLAVGAMLLRR